MQQKTPPMSSPPPFDRSASAMRTRAGRIGSAIGRTLALLEWTVDTTLDAAITAYDALRRQLDAHDDRTENALEHGETTESGAPAGGATAPPEDPPPDVGSMCPCHRRRRDGDGAEVMRDEVMRDEPMPSGGCDCSWYTWICRAAW